MNRPIHLSVLGYQLRVPIDSLSLFWSNDRRAKYLLDETIKNPISADPSVWPILDNAALAASIFKDFSSEQYSAPNGLSLYRISHSEITASCSSDDSGGLIVGICTEDNIADRLRSVHAIKTSSVTRSGNLFGFDVCDEWLTSGLTNCGIENAYHLALKDRFSKCLNRYGLFDEISIAKKYSSVIAKYIPSHVPFFPIGLFSARSPDGA